MSTAAPRIHICIGDPKLKHQEQLEESAALGQDRFDWWNITKSAQPGDKVIFYMRSPTSAFVASAVVDKKVIQGEVTGGRWYDPENCFWISKAKMLLRTITLDEAKKHFPKWPYLLRPVVTTIPNSRSPSELVQRFLALLEGNGTDGLQQVRTEKEREGAFSPSDLEDARKRILAAIVVRQGQGAFRDRLLGAYQHRCAVTGCDVVPALEAAHIVPYLGPDTNHVSNGLLLRGDIHTLFDLGLMALKPTDYRVMVSKSLKGSCYELLAGRVIGLPADQADYPSRRALEIRLAEFEAKKTGDVPNKTLPM